MNKKPFMIVIAGSTGVGKTDFSLSLAKQLPIEIVNADLGQFYQPLTIGTAKPEWQKDLIKHHLFDVFSTPQSCTVMEYRTLLLETLQDIWKRNKIPVIVGGSTFYIESIFFKPAQAAKLTIANAIESSSWDELNGIDPERAATIHPNDVYRIKRALAIWQASGIKPSLQKPIYDPPADFLFFYLTRDRDELYNRINQRVCHMFDTGWIDEVKPLINTEWHDFIKTKKFIGYPELTHYIQQGSCTNRKQELIDAIAKKTRNYAKRQETYWRRLEKKLHNCLVNSTEYTNKQMSKVIISNLTSLDLTVYCKQLSEQLSERSESRSL